MENFDLLEREMKASDKESDKFVALAVIAIIVLCAGLVSALFFFVENPQTWLAATVMPVILLSQAYFMRRSQQRRMHIFEKHGFRCQNCKRTPYSISLLKQTSKQFCPFCQLKYSP